MLNYQRVFSYNPPFSDTPGREVAPPLEFRCSWLTTGPRGQRWGEMGHSRDGGSAKETTEVDEAGPGFH